MVVAYSILLSWSTVAYGSAPVTLPAGFLDEAREGDGFGSYLKVMEPASSCDRSSSKRAPSRLEACLAWATSPSWSSNSRLIV